jgi:Ni/Fe-hydrogenase subunit HybB-like protein
LIPDLASLRDQTSNKALKFVFGSLAMGWRNSVRHWNRYETAYLLLGGLATPLVLSVHTVVSFDFAVGIVPGWHTTIFPPYFVAGAIYSGFAMVLVLAIPIRRFYGITDFITMRHLENSAMVMLATGWIVAYGYAFEAFMNWYGGDPYESFLRWNRLHGPYAWTYYGLLFTNLVVPQVLWFKKVRTNTILLFFVSLDVLVGMWLERFVIVVVSLSRDFLNSSFGQYYPTQYDWAIFVGTLGFFAACMFLFMRVLPAVSISELKVLLPQAEVKVEHEAEVHQ